MQIVLDRRGAAAMSGTTDDDDNRFTGERHFPLDAEFEMDLQCALTNTSPVLITAPIEIGAAVARRIHFSGVNRRGAFLTVDCRRTQLPEQLIMAFETASPRGTVFLQEVDRLAPALQQLLFFQIAPSGVRVIAGTSTSLVLAATQGTFDERLFYRLNQIHLVAAHHTVPSGAA
jgi:DNA-binding NtrC family response regulator